ncbi:hypothetical protein, partial [Neisseria meningitidis]|uniref:hypothetical protein n=1 Tax=Neisseria meningitidis TaxID=487 RepID=UPI001C8F61C3
KVAFRHSRAGFVIPAQAGIQSVRFRFFPPPFLLVHYTFPTKPVNKKQHFANKNDNQLYTNPPSR